MDSFIRLVEVSRNFQVGSEEIQALREISLTVGRGEYVSIMGPSGSGKSTLLNIIGLLDRPSSGRYLMNETDVTLLDDRQQADFRKRNIGFVFQFFHLVPRLTALKNVELPLVLASVPPAEREERAMKMLESVGLAHRSGHRPSELSAGQRQRVAIARAAITKPAVLLADEPTGNLDTRSGREIISLLEKLNEKGMTLIVVTHDPYLGRRARRQITLVDGRITSDHAGATGVRMPQ